MIESVSFTLRKAQVKRAFRDCYRQEVCSKAVILSHVYIWGASVLAFLVGVLCLYGYQDFVYSAKLLLVAASAYAAIVFSVWLLRYYVYSYLRATRRANLDPAIGKLQSWAWDDRYVSIEIGRVKGIYPLRLFYDWQDYPQFIALYSSAKKFHILPKSSLDQQQVDGLHATLSREIQKPSKRQVWLFRKLRISRAQG